MSTIEITLSGLLVTFVSPDGKECAVGFLDQTPPHHEFKISVLKSDGAGGFPLLVQLDEPDIAAQLSIDVTGTSTTGISQRVNGVNAMIARSSGPANGNDTSFLWVLDFERDLYHKPVGTNPKGFKSILTVNNGELLTRQISDNKLLTHLESTGTTPEEFGYVAVRIGIDIALDQPGSKAVFTNGGKPVFEADSQTNYKVIINRGLPLGHHHSGNDADSYYTAIGHLIPDPEKKFFSSTPLPPAPGPLPPNTPDAACFSGGGGNG